MKVVILDDWEKFLVGNPILDSLKQHFEVEIYHDHPSKEELIERLSSADAVIPIRERTRFTADLIEQLNIKVIAQTGSGVAHIDMEAARSKQIAVLTTPGGSSAVAELIFGFMLALSRKLIPLDRQVRDGMWPHSIGCGLENKTIGIIGLGKIGTKVANIAKAFNMNVIAWGPRLTEERAKENGVRYASLPQLLRESHFVTVNVRLVPETKRLLTKEHFDLMRKDAFFINTSRGEVVDEEALIEALRNRQIAGAGLDVFVKEPLDSDHPFFYLDNVILSPHIGWKTDNMFNQFFAKAVENVITFFQK